MESTVLTAWEAEEAAARQTAEMAARVATVDQVSSSSRSPNYDEDKGMRIINRVAVR